MTEQMQNSILQATENQVEGQLTPQVKADYLRVVVAGMKIALDKGPDGILGQLRNSKNVTYDCASGAINLCLLMYRQSRGTMPIKALVPAAMTLMLKALDFADKTGVAQIGNPDLVKATTYFTNLLFQRLGISQQMLAHAAGKIQQITRDPASMEAIKRAAGVVKDPRASQPTELPAAEAETEEA